MALTEQPIGKFQYETPRGPGDALTVDGKREEA
jgi:hypothetical protein